MKSKASGIVKQAFVHYRDWVLAELGRDDLQAHVRESRATRLAFASRQFIAGCRPE